MRSGAPKMGSDSSKLQNKSTNGTPVLNIKVVGKRRLSGTPSDQTTPPTIKVGASVSFNEGFLTPSTWNFF